MKKFMKFSFVALAVFALFGCASINPAEIQYTEISAKEFFDTDPKDLYAKSQGYKVTDVHIANINNFLQETWIEIKNPNDSFRPQAASVTDFLIDKTQNDPTWEERFNSIRFNERFNGHFTVYLYLQEESSFAWKLIVYNIEGIPTQEQIDASIAEEEKARTEQEAAEEKAYREKLARLDEKGKQIAKDYIYHGTEDVIKNWSLFRKGALEEGHAYYISGFVMKSGGTMAIIEGWENSPVFVTYKNQKIKGECASEYKSTVIVAGGKAPMHTPIVLGLIKEE